MQRTTIVAVILAAALIFIVSAPSAEAQCLINFKEVTNYWGYYALDGSVICASIIVGPWPGWPDIIGQTIRECDGTVWSWGDRTICNERGDDITYDYEQCPCIYASKTPRKLPRMSLPAITTAALTSWVSQGTRHTTMREALPTLFVVPGHERMTTQCAR